MSFRDKVVARLKELGMTRADLAERSGLSLSYVYKLLMEGQGNRENPSPVVRDRIAGTLGLLPSDLDDSVTVSDYLTEALHGLTLEEQQQLRSLTLTERLSLIVKLLRTNSRWRAEEDLAEALGLEPDILRPTLAGEEPEQAILRQLAQSTGLSLRFWLRGRLDPNPRVVSLILDHEQANEYVTSLYTAIEAGVQPGVLRDLVRAIKGGAS